MRFAPASIPPAERAPLARWKSGVPSLDRALDGGLAQGRVHEVYAAEEADAAACLGFGGAIAAGMAGRPAGGDRAVLWLRSQRGASRGGQFQANGWTELGGLATPFLLGCVPDVMALLRAAVDALRCAALGAVVVEGWGAMRELDLTASRRLALAAERSGVPLLLLRLDAAPMPSAAQTRWQVASAPSQALPANAPGRPTFDLVLLRQRAGPCGLSWRVEWNRDRYQFEEPAQEQAIPGAVVPLPADRPAADGGGGWPGGIARSAA